MVFAHVGGVPVEEFLPALAGTGTALLLFTRSWLTAHNRHRQDRGE